MSAYHHMGDKMRFTKLRQKTVINICDGKSLGCICDIIVECPCGNITAIVVPGCASIKSFFHARNFVIPWCSIVKIGDDVILVNADLNCCSVLE